LPTKPVKKAIETGPLNISKRKMAKTALPFRVSARLQKKTSTKATRATATATTMTAINSRRRGEIEIMPVTK